MDGRRKRDILQANERVGHKDTQKGGSNCRLNADPVACPNHKRIVSSLRLSLYWKRLARDDNE